MPQDATKIIQTHPLPLSTLVDVDVIHVSNQKLELGKAWEHGDTTLTYKSLCTMACNKTTILGSSNLHNIESGLDVEQGFHRVLSSLCSTYSFNKSLS